MPSMHCCFAPVQMALLPQTKLTKANSFPRQKRANKLREIPGANIWETGVNTLGQCTWIASQSGVASGEMVWHQFKVGSIPPPTLTLER